MEHIDKLISQNNFQDALKECDKNNFSNFKEILEKIIPDKCNFVKVLLCCNWCSNEEICNLWKKMSKDNNLTWNNIKIVSSEPCDFYCIVNKPPDNLKYDPKRSIILRMEPDMEKKKYIWREWSNPSKDTFKYICYHNNNLNTFEWHLSKTYNQLLNDEIIKEHDNILSTVLSDKYSDPGHIKRIDFVKFLESKNMEVHVFGGNKFSWVNYKGSLPPHQKDNAMFPYKYSFNVENHSIKNYCTEKLIDGILSETLVFYSGCYNIKEYIDERSYVYLELIDFEKDYETIKKAISEDWWSQRLPYIKESKNKILNEYQFYPKIEKIINMFV